MSSSLSIQAQTYRFSPYPDLWYNDVDGVRLGLRVLGEVEGTFKDGPHRLDAGVWVGSKLPENPISYYISFTEPIAAFSDFGSEGSVQVISSSRAGYALHQLRLNKRWQKGFDELDYFEISVYGSYEKNFDSSYRFNPTIWSNEWSSSIGSDLFFSRMFDKYRMENSFILKTNGNDLAYLNFESLNAYNISKDFKIRLRVYLNASNNFQFGEYQNGLFSGAPIEWLNSGIQRADGIISRSMINDGFVHFSGGANLRGYSNRTNETFSEGIYTQYLSVYSTNIELVFPNPVDNAINKNTLIADLLAFESYFLIDLGKGLSQVINREIYPKAEFPDNPDSELLMDAGLGFQLSANIPDYLGKDRGIFIRYDIPLWLSSPSNNESNFKYRNVVGIGAIFNF